MFKPEEREIFEYHDGQKERKGDPLAIVAKLYGGEIDLDADVKLFISEDESPEGLKTGFAAMVRVAEIVRVAFGIKSFEDGGLLDIECCRLVNEFFAWLAEVKKKQKPTQTELQPTGSPLDKPSTTDSGLGCC